MHKQKEQNKVTIGLPIYNAERFLQDTIKSILNQTYTNFELLIVDDGSTDSSIEIIQSFNDSRIKFIRDGNNKGLSYRLNQIAKLTKTIYLARMNADDIMHPERIEKQLKVLENNLEIDVLGSNAYSINEHNNVKGIRMKKSSELIRVNNFIHPTIMAKLEWFLENPYDNKIKRAEDAELWFRTSKTCNLYVLNEPLLFYREFGVNYYIKYQKGIVSVFYISKKYMNEFAFNNSIIWFFIGIKYIFKYFIYLLLNLFRLEYLLINKRNIEIEDFERALAFKTLQKATRNIN